MPLLSDNTAACRRNIQILHILCFHHLKFIFSPQQDKIQHIQTAIGYLKSSPALAVCEIQSVLCPFVVAATERGDYHILFTL